ncbi:MAG: single-stranded DNA-binding protein [Dehalococcoidales bacterium]|jgi:single-strand DNA-binding protein|nr:single-stranded DNA-binding protein [Dehalococcoidales bacterium]MDP6737607.1 single-stranded DNA-binding protein [Dehalococcoidales bacterium]|tara:strand:- start:246 stop:656 length:411 start_codon:yes stop_codon:yes gene_type:complete
MVSVNKIIIIGNLGGEPEMRFTPNGRPVTSFNVATNWRYTTADGERREETEWFTVVTWGRLAEQCNQFLNKGRLVYVEGRLHTHSWESQDGQKHSRNEIIANRVSFLDRQAVALSPDEKAAESTGGDEIEPDDLPF